MDRIDHTEKWYDHACAFVDMKWPDVAATTRRTHAEAMTAATMLLFASTAAGPMTDSCAPRSGYGRSTPSSVLTPRCPWKIRSALAWARRNSRPVSVLANPDNLRPVVSGIGQKIDGDPLASSVAGRPPQDIQDVPAIRRRTKTAGRNPLDSLKTTKVARNPRAASTGGCSKTRCKREP